MESQEKEGGDDQDNLEKVGAFAKQSTGGFVSPSGRSLAASVAASVSQHCRLNIQTSNITECLNMRGIGWVQMQTKDILFDLTIAS